MTDYYGNNIFGLQELVSGSDIPVLLGWTVKNTDTPLKIHRADFRGLSGILICFSRVPV